MRAAMLVGCAALLLSACSSEPLDATIDKMLREGAQADLTEYQLTLATADHTPAYKLDDPMH